MKNLTSENVENVFNDCLIRDGEDVPQAKTIEGVVHNFRFHPLRLAEHKAEIAELLRNLPDEFQSDKGEGWSFLNACMTRDGIQWGEQRSVELLLALGIATEQARILFPRSMWNMFPGGVPYFVVYTNHQ